MTLLNRSAAAIVQAALTDTPVVVINGPRQAGKTTLTQRIEYPGSHDFVSLDDEPILEAARQDIRNFVSRPVDTFVIDEAQLEPRLFRAIKAAVDRDRRPGRFVLTGSSRLLSAPDMAASLVGRVETIDLWPFSQGELDGVRDTFVDVLFESPVELVRNGATSRQQIVDRIVTGGYPEIINRSQQRRTHWFKSYLTTITQSVIRDISAVEHLAEIPKLLQLCATRTGNELNVSAVANDLGLPGRTVDGYLAVLAQAFLIERIPAWSTNLSKKVIRRPKLVMTDTGLAAHLIRASSSTTDRIGGPFGQLLETFVANEIRKQLTWSTETPSLWHFRDRDGAEVDLVLEHPDGRVVGIEVKATSTPSSTDLRGLRYLADRLGDRFHFGVLLHTAPEATRFGPNIAALPVSALWTPVT
ncbi:ATP-binding protein [Streptomyces sp. SID13031]|uniref:ATP-binding protein n=1 Tax=Streptomyces sp. SID13031 TaxID=2706046 RepID=UPI0013CA7BB0|nr:ATP-binding protein [Streptomyces sp. SID13031]NEA36698.1 ATP-binding protein [Streptomyces sp. SID13031]